MKYQIKDREKFFVRDDGNVSLVLFKEKHDQFILNNTGLVMFNLILDNNETEDVIKELKKNYQNVDAIILNNDLEDIIRMLKIYGIISIEEENIQEVPKIESVTAVDENNYEIIGNFIENNRCEEFFVAGGKGYYTAVNIRAHIMNNQEYYYCKNDEYGNIVGVIVIVPNVNNNSVVNVTALVVSKDKEEEERREIEKELLAYVRESMINQVNKFRISFYQNPNRDVSFLKMFETLGFEKEAELKKEYKKKSLFLYSLYQ